jgi:hypothetical protein
MSVQKIMVPNDYKLYINYLPKDPEVWKTQPKNVEEAINILATEVEDSRAKKFQMTEYMRKIEELRREIFLLKEELEKIKLRKH